MHNLNHRWDDRPDWHTLLSYFSVFGHNARCKNVTRHYLHTFQEYRYHRPYFLRISIRPKFVISGCRLRASVAAPSWWCPMWVSWLDDTKSCRRHDNTFSKRLPSKLQQCIPQDVPVLPTIRACASKGNLGDFVPLCNAPETGMEPQPTWTRITIISLISTWVVYRVKEFCRIHNCQLQHFQDQFWYQEDSSVPYFTRIVTFYFQQEWITKMRQPKKSSDCNHIFGMNWGLHSIERKIPNWIHLNAEVYSG